MSMIWVIYTVILIVLLIAVANDDSATWLVVAWFAVGFIIAKSGKRLEKMTQGDINFVAVPKESVAELFALAERAIVT
jgi:hypothetical protein